MFRPIVAALIAFGLAQAAAAEDYRDPSNGFRLTVPDGWSKDQPSSAGKLDLVLRSPRYETTRGTCPLAADPFAATNGKTQDEINKELEPEINEAFWRAALGGGSLPEFKVDETGSELRDGRRVFTVTARFSSDLKGAKAWVRMKATFQVGPGHIGAATCMSWLEESAVDDADIAVILGTFESSKPVVVAALPPQAPGRLTLFVGKRFDGQRREFTQDMPDLFAAGWSAPAASFALGGAGLWQVCDGRNYTGNCRLLAGAGPSDRPLRIVSARRIAETSDARGALGVVTDTLGALTAEAAERMRKDAR